MPAIGDKAPAITALDQSGKTVNLSDFLGKTVVLYFYPKDDTSGCTLEACDFRDSLGTIDGLPIIGVSPDSIKSHAKFATKYSLNFTLLADEEKSLIGQLGLWIEKSMYGRKYMGVDRTTYIVDEKGIIVRVFRKVKPEGHAREVKDFLSV